MNSNAVGLHTFVVPAYGQSPHLRACLASLSAQADPSPVVVCTSTPYAGLDVLVAEYGASLFVHVPNAGIGHDWNVAMDQAKTQWVTLAHQDDIYHPHFTQGTLAAAAAHEDALLILTGYEEWIENERREKAFLPRIKSLLLELGFLGRLSVRSSWAKTNCLRFGNAISCPAVTLNRSAAPFRFDENLRVNLDWAAWLDLCNVEGSFVWVRDKLMAHRIHAGSETTNAIGGGYRAQEDEAMLRRVWPAWMVGPLLRFYALAYSSNSK